MEKEVKKIIKDIKSLKIQGARNIAKSVIRALIIQIKNSKAKTLNSLYSELLAVSDALASARPTEPMVRNYIQDTANFAFSEIRSGKSKTVKKLKSDITHHVEDYLKKMDSNSKKLSDYGSKLISEGSIVMTYCHSSTVTGILKRAKEKGRNFEVIVCETRPKLQGRLTAKELISKGIKTTLIVDSAMNVFMKKADLCIVGADAVTSTGDLINKIGTSTLAHIARFQDVSFYSAAELYKYSPLSLYGTREIIEERDPDEIWKSPPKKLKINNPAFDATAARYINAYITEEGLISPHFLFSLVNRKFKGVI